MAWIIITDSLSFRKHYDFGYACLTTHGKLDKIDLVCSGPVMHEIC